MSGPVNYQDAVLSTLRSIDTTLKVILARTPIQALSSHAVADDRDLDGTYGDPEVKFNPRDWNGDSCKGLHMSACPAPFLEMIAETFDYFGDKAAETGELTAAGKPVEPYKRRDAARARGWAARVRAGHVARPAATVDEMEPSPFERGPRAVADETFDDIPF